MYQRQVEIKLSQLEKTIMQHERRIAVLEAHLQKMKENIKHLLMEEEMMTSLEV